MQMIFLFKKKINNKVQKMSFLQKNKKMKFSNENNNYLQLPKLPL